MTYVTSVKHVISLILFQNLTVYTLLYYTISLHQGDLLLDFFSKSIAYKAIDLLLLRGFILNLLSEFIAF